MDEELSESLPLDETAPRRARELVEPLRDTIGIRSFEAIRQVVAELLGQCVRDARPQSDVRVCLRRPSSDLVEIEVSRPVIGMTDTPPVDRDHAARIAFQVVDRLVDEWGVREDSDQVTVWIRIHVATLTHPDR